MIQFEVAEQLILEGEQQPFVPIQQFMFKRCY